MDSEALIKYIQEVGYRTSDEVNEKFSSENKEILNAIKDSLLSRNKIRKIKFQSPKGGLELFYITSNE